MDIIYVKLISNESSFFRKIKINSPWFIQKKIKKKKKEKKVGPSRAMRAPGGVVGRRVVFEVIPSSSSPSLSNLHRSLDPARRSACQAWERPGCARKRLWCGGLLRGAFLSRSRPSQKRPRRRSCQVWRNTPRRVRLSSLPFPSPLRSLPPF